MQFDLSTHDPATFSTDMLIVPLFEGKSPLDDYGYGKALKGRFFTAKLNGKADQAAMVASADIMGAKAVYAAGIGSEKSFILGRLRVAVCKAVRNKTASDEGLSQVAIDLHALFSALGGGAKKVALPGGASGLKVSLARWIGQAIAEGAELGAYTYTKFFSPGSDRMEKRPVKLTLLADKKDHAELRSGMQIGQAIAAGVNFCRDVCNDPNNIMRPGDLARATEQLARTAPGLKYSVLNKGELVKLKMGSLLSVNAGSADGDGAARIICLEYHGGKKGSKPLCLIGKGITFDTGGYSLKSPQNMLGMKWDMGGAATVIGAIYAAAKAKLPLNIVALAPATENLVNEHATKPGDVVRSMSGKTIEIKNTDAEGRLILCDTLTYAQKHYKPDTMIDVATLTGAVVTALGDQVFATMTPQDQLAAELADAARDADELLWRLPLVDEYDSYINSEIADMGNVSDKPVAGTITAGLFLKRFVDADQKWAHLDIAGVANTEGSQKGVAPSKGATGTAVRTLVALARARANA